MDIQFKRRNGLKGKTIIKRDGNAFMVGVFGLFTLVTFIVIFTIAIEEIHYKRNATTDAITSAILATVTIDKDDLTLNNNIHVIPAEMNVKMFSDCFAGSLRTVSEVTVGVDLTEKIYTWTGNEDDPIFDFSDGKKIELSQFIIYNFDQGDPADVNDDSFTISKYNSRTGGFDTEAPLLLRDIGHLYAPDGTEILETSVFVELNVPIHTYFNIRATVPRSQLVAIQNIA